MKKSLFLFPFMAFFASACSTNEPVPDNEDNEVNYKVNFVYDMNMDYADAFSQEVHSVNLYAFDKQGKFVKEFKANGTPLDHPGFQIDLALAPGDYTLLAWCGLDNVGAANDSFTVPDPVKGKTTLQEMSCLLNTSTINGLANSSASMIQDLYHGLLDVKLPDVKDGMNYSYTMHLVKDTNHIRVVLQKPSVGNMDPANYEFRLEAPNGEMAWDNTPIGDKTVNYLAWHKSSVSNTANGEDGDITYTGGVIAELSTCRMLADQANEMKLTIFNSEKNEVVVSIPLIGVALQCFGAMYGQMAYQEWLDREDQYNLIFYLDKNEKCTSIQLNSCRISFPELVD